MASNPLSLFLKSMLTAMGFLISAVTLQQFTCIQYRHENCG